MAKFTHLHVHTEYSLLDGLCKISDLVKRAKKLGMDSLAISDHGVMYGAIEFYKECRKEGIKPIVGMEGYVVNGSHKQKEGKADKENNHLTLLAQNERGYKNLMILTTIAHLEGFYYRPRFDKETFKKYSEGLIVLSGCHQGEISKLLVEGHYDKARNVASWYREILGENYFLEIQRHHFSDFIDSAQDRKIKTRLEQMQKTEDVAIPGIIKLSRELGIPLASTCDVHYLDKKNAFAQDVLVCISTGRNVSDIDRLRYVDAPTLFLRSEEEMRDLFADVSDAVDNTAKIAESVNFEMELGRWLFPVIEIPGKKRPEEYISQRCQEGIKNKYKTENSQASKRLEYELDVIIKKGYAPYFLMMADLVNWCTQKGIITNTRGSAAGSIVSYVLGITTVDPLHYALPFERFLNPLRPKPPDIDLDIADNRREELLEYIVKKYGSDKVAQICTFGRMLARAAVRDVGRALGYPYSVPDRIAKLIPLGSQGFPMTIKHALDIAPELSALYNHDKGVKRILDTACEIEGSARHASVHAAGVVISPDQVTDYTPLQLEPKGEKVITQYEMNACLDVGLVKFDILGIRNLSILQSAAEIVEKSTGTTLNLNKLPLDDKKVFEMLARGETMGVFQLGGSGMTKWLKELKPNRLEDIMVMIALFRPGPMANIPEFIARKNGKKFKYLHPKMEKYLDKSYGILVYQEDVLFTALELAGYNWESVDKLRNAMGKKIPAEMAKQHDTFIDGCQKNSGLSKTQAEQIWELFVPFQGYGFNKAHAASYGIVSYQTAYIKAYFPVEYMTALLSAEAGDTDKVTEAIVECRRMGVLVLPPDINRSQSGFTIEKNKESLNGKAIRFGLSAIKNVGHAAIDPILQARKMHGFSSLADFCQRVDPQKVNKKVLESLIKVGAMDEFGKRAEMMAGLENIRKRGEEKRKKEDGGQGGLFPDVEKPDLKSDYLPTLEEFSENERLGMERELLGFYLTEHPLSRVLANVSMDIFMRISNLESDESSQKIRIGGIVSSVRIVTTKNGGNEMAFAAIEDETGKIEAVVFPKVFASTRNLWIKDQVVIVDGKVEKRDEVLSIIVESAQSVSYAASEEFDFAVRIPKKIKPQTLININKLLKENHGESRGVLIFENGSNLSKKLPLGFGVNYSRALEKQVQKMLSEENGK